MATPLPLKAPPLELPFQSATWSVGEPWSSGRTASVAPKRTSRHSTSRIEGLHLADTELCCFTAECLPASHVCGCPSSAATAVAAIATSRHRTVRIKALHQPPRRDHVSRVSVSVPVNWKQQGAESSLIQHGKRESIKKKVGCALHDRESSSSRPLCEDTPLRRSPNFTSRVASFLSTWGTNQLAWLVPFNDDRESSSSRQSVWYSYVTYIYNEKGIRIEPPSFAPLSGREFMVATIVLPAAPH